jgi:HEAT repeat protein
MFRMSIGMLVGTAMGVGGWWTPVVHATGPQALAMATRDSTAPRAWLPGDPGDSLYRAAREALDRRDYRRAADLFAELATKYGASGYAADSYYWRAFALYRLGSTPQLTDALNALDTQRNRFPDAATKGDAAALRLRIHGELAKRGNAQSRAYIDSVAHRVVGPTPPTPPTAPVPPVGPTPPVPPTAPVPPTPPSSRDCDDEDDISAAAVGALQNMDEERARPILIRLLAKRDPASACVRRKALFIIAQQDKPGNEDILLGSARNDPDHEVREQAVFWLSQVNTDKAVSALDSIIRTSKDASLQEKAVFAISQNESDRARQALRSYADRADLSEDVREKVIFWIGQQSGKDNDAFLRTLYTRIKGDELKEKVLFSVSQAGGPENGRWLLRMSQDASQPVELRKKALFWAGQTDTPVADLLALYGSMPDKEMKEQLIFVYSQRDEPAAVDKLMDIAKREQDPELRKKAIFWLGQSDDPRAAKMLEDIIGQ